MEFIRKAEETGEVHAASSPGAPFMAPSLRSASSDASSTFLPSVSSRKGHRKQKSSTGSTDKGSPLARDMGSVTHVPKRAELNRVIGADMEKPLTEIDGIPCAGVRITHGTMSGLMAWRFVVRLDASAPRTKRLSSMRPAVVVNFILDTGSESSYVPPAALTALNYLGDTNPGAEVTLLVQGVKTKCKVAHPDEAGRVGLSFMTAGSLTYYFDASLVAPVLYDGSGERPARVPRTIRAEDLPRGSWVALVKAKILAIFGLSH
ncbi:hypothetical protein DFH07DRAFT_217890 [Mycena maculata]|uniref:Uncharacterized protein n=1 Tax=Mycena maculata TaxID=230809 RepID=A0AAD7HV68_9AGAR|nr:hypothetical protein DFH07DRAFT_217890 [Mycena maculata]